ncbi:MAG: UDP-2,3-diacylglucosamine diphosphatase [Pseudomonadota bacterium]
MSPPRVALISDLHLDPSAPDTQALAVRYLETALDDVRALFILGDLFEAWVGDDDPVDWAEPFLAALSAVSSRGVAITLMHGNRDFLIGETFADRVGATVNRADTAVIELGARRAVVMHGDTLCTDDADYLAVRANVRTPAWQRAFLAQPLADRQAQAKVLRAESRAKTATKRLSLTDANVDACESALQDHRADWLIHGHTHRPGSHPCGEGTRYVLGEWLANGATVALLDPAGVQLAHWPPRPNP